MHELTFRPADANVPMTPAPQRHTDGVWVPLAAFCAAVGATVKDIDGAGQLAVCGDGDLCIRLPAGDVRAFAGTTFARLEAFADPLGLNWQVTDNDTLILDVGAAVGSIGLRFGDRPPPFELPDVQDARVISSDVYYGKPAVFYMWASW